MQWCIRINKWSPHIWMYQLIRTPNASNKRTQLKRTRSRSGMETSRLIECLTTVTRSRMSRISRGELQRSSKRTRISSNRPARRWMPRRTWPQCLWSYLKYLRAFWATACLNTKKVFNHLHLYSGKMIWVKKRVLECSTLRLPSLHGAEARANRSSHHLGSITTQEHSRTCFRPQTIPNELALGIVVDSLSRMNVRKISITNSK